MDKINKKLTTINLCDRSFIWLKNNLVDINKNNLSKIQFGSYVCGNYFKKCLEFIESNQMTLKKYDLVIPVLSEHELSFLKTEIFQKYLKKAETLVINDLGILLYLKKKQNIRLGRMLIKDYRDYRYSEFNNSNYESKANTLIVFLINQGYFITGVESDIITKDFHFQNNYSVELYLHYPYRQVSSCHICEYASIGKNIKEKFLPDDKCSMQCSNVLIKSLGENYIKVGKSVFDHIDDSYLSDSILEKKIILTPRWEDENNGFSI